MRNQKLKPWRRGIFLAAAALSIHTEANASSTDFIVNGTFSDPSSSEQTGWNVMSDAYRFLNNSYQEGDSPIINLQATIGSLSQNVLDKGGTDTLSFNLSTPDGGTESVAWNNTVLADLSNPNSNTYSYQVAATGNDTLTFMGRNDASFNIISNVSLVPAVPEPEPAAMLLVGLGLIGWMARRKTAANA
ncbi:MAG: FxDxF family PEP-CTERM protein [Burkholderiales bacterium]